MKALVATVAFFVVFAAVPGRVVAHHLPWSHGPMPGPAPSYGYGTIPEYYPSPDTREKVKVTEAPGGGRVIERSPDHQAIIMDGLSKAVPVAALLGSIILIGGRR